MNRVTGSEQTYLDFIRDCKMLHFIHNRGTSCENKTKNPGRNVMIHFARIYQTIKYFFTSMRRVTSSHCSFSSSCVDSIYVLNYQSTCCSRNRHDIHSSFADTELKSISFATFSRVRIRIYILLHFMDGLNNGKSVTRFSFMTFFCQTIKKVL